MYFSWEASAVDKHGERYDIEGVARCERAAVEESARQTLEANGYSDMQDFYIAEIVDQNST